uniref:Uncharacterized protein n=1 Tax=uncultured marine virus TaxID=186617 RepID=A0A0F7L313_9VIRU|nr:hypothetical protein AM1_A0038 [uncultured marine virus]
MMTFALTVGLSLGPRLTVMRLCPTPRNWRRVRSSHLSFYSMMVGLIGWLMVSTVSTHTLKRALRKSPAR